MSGQEEAESSEDDIELDLTDDHEDNDEDVGQPKSTRCILLKGAESLGNQVS